MIDLHNDYVSGEDRHPVSLTAAYNAVINYKPKGKIPSKNKKQQKSDWNQLRGQEKGQRDIVESEEDEEDNVKEDINMANIEKGKKTC